MLNSSAILMLISFMIVLITSSVLTVFRYSVIHCSSSKDISQENRRSTDGPNVA